MQTNNFGFYQSCPPAPKGHYPQGNGEKRGAPVGHSKYHFVDREVLDLGFRSVIYGTSGKCKYWHDCFTCPDENISRCKGGDY